MIGISSKTRDLARFLERKMNVNVLLAVFRASCAERNFCSVDSPTKSSPESYVVFMGHNILYLNLLTFIGLLG